MNKIIPFTLATMLSTPVTASDTCLYVAQLAEAIMEIRQENIPITELLSAVEDPETISGMAILAYKHPLQKMPSAKKEAIVNFGTLFFIVCTENEEPEGIAL